MSANLKYIIIGLMVLITMVIAAIVYRMFFQFNSKEIEIYAREEAAKYGANAPTVYALILEGVQHVLSSHSLTRQVLTSAKRTGTDKEQLLVQAAIAQCVAFSYLKPKN
jgi:flagellar basal body-associated protein FliL